MHCYEVAVVAPLATPLTYGPLVEDGPVTTVGLRVLVPLGDRLVTGYILDRVDPPDTRSGKDPVTIRPIVDLLDRDPLFPSELVPLYRWIADYYHYPIGEVIRTALPGGITATSGHILRLSEQGKKEQSLLAGDRRYGDAAWMRELLANGKLPAAKTARLWRKPALQRRLKAWATQGLVIIEDVLIKEKNRRKLEKVIVPIPEVDSLLQDCAETTAEGMYAYLIDHLDLSPGKAEQTLLTRFLTIYLAGGGRPVSKRDLNRAYANAGKILKRPLLQRIFTEEERRLYRDPFGGQPQSMQPPSSLTGEQEEVLSRIVPTVEAGTFTRFLLFGVTGCGKTEVYLQAAQKALAMHKTVLVLVPEIALSSQLEAHFYSRFGDTLAVLHSGLSSGQRLDEWQRILSGRARVVIGARSAVFAPLSDIGLIIVDEEHESSYKQDSGLCYNGRDLAVLRAKFSRCPVVLGSATPSLTSFYHADTGRYTLLTMKKRVADQRMPDVEIVNLATVKKSRQDLFFSDRLIHALEDNLARGRQSLLFVNRRGYAAFMLCRDCGHVIRCRHCRVSMTLHRGAGQLVCHYCGYTLPTNILCPGCRTGKIVPLGLGSERIENEVAQILPQARIARLDSDTAGSRKEYLALLGRVRSRDIDILIGTQMIAKGLHFPHVTLVGVVWADSGLNMPDYKATERTFSLLSQVTGRAGRGEQSGRVIIQTHQPGHCAVSFARKHDYTGFYTQEIAVRRDLGYPPFSRLVNLRFSGTAEAQVQEAANRVAAFCRSHLPVKEGEVLGPAPAPLALLRDRYRYQILIKGFSPASVHRLCNQVLAGSSSLVSRQVRLTIDVDPENMM
ncbi:MAG TPA: primosomal protein N' [Desulfobulbus sp.]|nr:primosomal protein N' [Desulfobulbus sp.]